MALTIITKNSDVAGLVPSAGQLVKGELAVNVTDRALYTLDAANNVVLLSSGSNYTSPLTVTVNSSSTAVTVTQTGSGGGMRITNTGAGNSLLVEDAANPDSTPFVIDASGNVGIGATTASQKLDLSSDSTLVIQSTRYSTDASESAITVRKARGTGASPSIVSSGDTVTSLNFQGYDGAAFLNVARIFAQVDGTPGTNDMPGRLVFSTTADGAS